MWLSYLTIGGFALWVLADVFSWLNLRKRDGVASLPWNWRVLLGGFSYFAWLEKQEIDD